MRYMDREPVYTCGSCRDTGLAEIWHPAVIRFFREVFSESPPESWGLWDRDPRWKAWKGPKYRSHVAACNCAKGRVDRKTKLVEYNPDKHCLFDPFSGAGLYEWLNREHCYDPVTGDYDYGLGDF